jgi:succinoglycan biosynthesis transport protein ExoP
VTQIEHNSQTPGSLVVYRNERERETIEDLGYGELFATFWRNRYLFLKISSGVLLLGILVSFLRKPTYESYMRILVEPNYWDKQEQKVESDTSFKADYATQLNLMRSPKLLNQAVQQLKSEYPDITFKKLRKDYKIERLVEDKNAREIETKIFEGIYTSTDPIKTQKVLDVIQNIYQKYNEQQQENSLKGGLGFVSKQLPISRQNAIEAEAVLKQFRQQYNLIAPEKEAEIITQQLRRIEQLREDMNTRYKETQSRYSEIQKQLGDSPENATLESRLSESSRFQNLLNQLQKIQIELEQQRSVFTETNPSIQNLIEKQNNQRQLLEEEVKRVLGKVPAGLDLNSQSLQKQGQLGKSDVQLTRQLLEVQADLATLKERDRGLATTEAKLHRKLDLFPALLGQYNNLKQEVEVTRGTLKQLLEARQKLGIEIDRGGFRWDVVEPPQEGLKIAPNLAKDLLLSGIISLFIGGAGVFVRELIDNRVRTAEQLKQQTRFPLLGEVPQFIGQKRNLLADPLYRNFRSEDRSRLSTLQLVQWQPFRESLDLIYTNMQLMDSFSQLRSLVITSTAPGEGKSTLSLGLAISAARLDRKVLVIDADLRQASLHKKLDLENYNGLSEMLSGQTNQPNIQRLGILGSTIDLLSAGSLPLDPVKLLNTQRLEKLIQYFTREYDLVLVDTPPVLEMVDAMKISSCCDGALLVVRLDEVNKTQVEESISLLSKLNLLGIIANGSKNNKLRYYQYQRYINTSLPEADDFS